MKNKFTYTLIFLFAMLAGSVFCQKNTTDPNGYNKFFYDNGKISSEGTLKDGKPDGYWKTYYENGNIKSEGNRKNYSLDSSWKFYDENGKLALEMNYIKGKKNGEKKTYAEKRIIIENFKDDVKHGLTNIYTPDGKLVKTILFENGREEGISKEFDETGEIITITEYRGGVAISQENINRRDKAGLKQGKWKNFYNNGKLKEEIEYRNSLKSGFYKEYDTTGNLKNITKYLNDTLLKDVQEIVKLDIKNEYYDSGKLKSVGSYKNKVPEGIKRQYNEDGKIVKAEIFKNGNMVGEGIVDEKGFKQGAWKEKYETGELRAEGIYKDGKKFGEWKFYFKNGKLEQKGKFIANEKAHGTWLWYFENGQIEREEIFDKGKEEGYMKEYNDSGKVIAEGNYSDGLKEDLWKYNIGDYLETGNYKNGAKNGIWQGFYKSGKKAFEGAYADDAPDGKHSFWFDNGQICETGSYAMGKKDGDWVKYNNDGTVFLTVSYKDGLEINYNGVKIVPEFDKSDQEILY